MINMKNFIEIEPVRDSLHTFGYFKSKAIIRKDDITSIEITTKLNEDGNEIFTIILIKVKDEKEPYKINSYNGSKDSKDIYKLYESLKKEIVEDCKENKMICD